MSAGLRVSSRSRYAPFLDGARHRLRRGIDFDATPVNARTELYRAAKRRGLRVRVSLNGATGLCVEAYDVDAV